MKYCYVVFLVIICTSCVQETFKRTVSFSVDMSHESDVLSVGVRGDFDPLVWDEDFLLTDKDNDSIYTGTITFDTPFDFVSIKFVKNNSVFELNGKDNRKVYFDKLNESTKLEVIFNEE